MLKRLMKQMQTRLYWYFRFRETRRFLERRSMIHFLALSGALTVPER